MFPRFLLIALSFSLQSAFAATYKVEYPVYNNPEILITDLQVDVNQVSQEISLSDKDLGVAKMTQAGDLLRVPEFQEYILWYQANFHPSAQMEFLKPRSPKVHKILESNWGKYIIIPHTFGKDKYLTVFVDGLREPVFIDKLDDNQKISDWVSTQLLKGNKQRRLTPTERKAEQERPEDVYYEPLRLDRFIAFGLGHHTPFPNVKAANFDEFGTINFSDSTNIYRWATVASPMYQLNIGILYEEIIGGGLVFNYSNLAMAFNPSTNPGVKVWYYDRYDFGAFTTFGKTYRASPELSFYPHVYVGYQYVIFDEDFQLRTPNIRAENRIMLRTLTKATGSLNLRMMYGNQWGLEASYGLSHISGKSPENFQTDGTGGTGSTRPRASVLNEQMIMLQLVWNSRKEL